MGQIYTPQYSLLLGFVLRFSHCSCTLLLVERSCLRLDGAKCAHSPLLVVCSDRVRTQQHSGILQNRTLNPTRSTDRLHLTVPKSPPQYSSLLGFLLPSKLGGHNSPVLILNIGRLKRTGSILALFY